MPQEDQGLTCSSLSRHQKCTESLEDARRAPRISFAPWKLQRCPCSHAATAAATLEPNGQALPAASGLDSVIRREDRASGLSPLALTLGLPWPSMQRLYYLLMFSAALAAPSPHPSIELLVTVVEAVRGPYASSKAMTEPQGALGNPTLGKAEAGPQRIWAELCGAQEPLLQHSSFQCPSFLAAAS